VIQFRAAAAHELADCIRYYDEHYFGRGQRFARSVDRTLSLIDQLPRAFPVLYEPDVRSAKVAKFPYRVVYVVLEPDIDVLAVAHAKRRAGYWRDRLA
jgi:hypothetical protein